MRLGRVLLLPIFIAFLLLPTAAQQTSTVQGPQRDSQATTLLQAAVRAMGGSAPQDSIALGSITLVEGSLTASGTIRILTRGTDQTSVQLQTNTQSSSFTYSKGQASKTDSNTATALPLERAASSQSVYFPLPFLSGFLSNPDVALQYIGPETLNSRVVQHIQATNTFRSLPPLQFLSAFTTRDVWLDASTNLPSAVSFVRRDGGGATPQILVSVSYSNFQTTSGVTYPQQIQESINGTTWMTITLPSIALNTGLTDADFTVVGGSN